MGTDLCLFRTKRRPKPFLKWVGGKQRLRGVLAAEAPTEFGKYFEPMVGGGTLFWELAHMGRLRGAILSDTCRWLMWVYQAVRDRVAVCLLIEQLVEYGKRMVEDEDHSFFYAERKKTVDPSFLGSAPLWQRAALFAYLVSACYNALPRWNSDGMFNTAPMSGAGPERLPTPELLHACSSALRASHAVCATLDFRCALSNAEEGDFVYLDPPYDETEGCYGPDSAQESLQEAVAAEFGRLDGLGVKVMASNLDTERIRLLYAGFAVKTLNVGRPVNCQGGGRGRVQEVLVKNF